MSDPYDYDRTELRRAATYFLVGPDNWDAYLEDAQYHATVDALVLMLPMWFEALGEDARKAADVHKRFHKLWDAQNPITPELAREMLKEAGFRA